eukprot:Colp12_sorted_trinity150504_noHs@12573
MSAKPAPAQKQKAKSPLLHLLAGGSAGLIESLSCHPLDTIKTRMQLSRNVGKRAGPFSTGADIVRKEGGRALYKGLTAVVSGIVPKMAIRFSSFEWYKELMTDKNGKLPTSKVFLAGLMSGVTEAVAVVTPMEVVKIRLQAQRHSMQDPHDVPKYKGTLHAAFTIVREEGLGALYKGVIPTVLRQATNQAVNFTGYQEIKKYWCAYQGVTDLQPWQHFLTGAISGAMGPLANSPIDVIKTRLQKQRTIPGQAPKYNGVWGTITTMLKEEGIAAFYKGLSPRLMRIVPGQAITFTVYEKVSTFLTDNVWGRPEEKLPELAKAK